MSDLRAKAEARRAKILARDSKKVNAVATEEEVFLSMHFIYYLLTYLINRSLLC